MQHYPLDRPLTRNEQTMHVIGRLDLAGRRDLSLLYDCVRVAVMATPLQPHGMEPHGRWIEVSDPKGERVARIAFNVAPASAEALLEPGVDAAVAVAHGCRRAVVAERVDGEIRHRILTATERYLVVSMLGDEIAVRIPDGVAAC